MFPALMIAFGVVIAPLIYDQREHIPALAIALVLLNAAGVPLWGARGIAIALIAILAMALYARHKRHAH